jgi:hypothetical protein
VVKHVNDTTSGTITSYDLTYNDKGLPTSRIYYQPGTTDVSSVLQYYYTGDRLDSIMGNMDNNRVGQRFGYDTLGNLISVYNGLLPFQRTSNAMFGYNGTQLSYMWIQEREFIADKLLYEGEVIKTGIVPFHPYGGTSFTDVCTFLFDTIPNPFYQKIGIVDNPWQYLFKTSFLGIYSPKNNGEPINSWDISYDSASHLLKTIKYASVFTDMIVVQSSHYQYACRSELVTSMDVKDKREDITSVVPNPSADGVFKLNIDQLKGKLYTSTGEFMFEVQTPTIDLSTYPSGFYVLKVSYPKGNKVVRLVKI